MGPNAMLAAGGARLSRTVAARWPVGRHRYRVVQAVDRHLRTRPPVDLAWTTRWGGRFTGSTGDYIDRTAAVTGLWEPSLTTLLEGHLGAGDTFVDVGASFGYYSVLASRRVGPDGTVIAVEPNPPTRRRLRAHLEANGCTNVDVRSEAVGAGPGRATLYPGSPGNVGSASLTLGPTDDGAVEVDVAPLPELVGAAWERARVVKIDVEGFEVPVLEACWAHLDRLPADAWIFLEVTPAALVDHGSSVRAIVDRFAGHGWSARLVTSNRWDYVRPPTRPTRPLAPEDHDADVIDLLLHREGAGPDRHPAAAHG